MRAIPAEIKKKMALDPFMKKCFLCGATPQWHHPWIYSGRQIVDAWATVPMCKKHHDEIKTDKRIRMLAEKVSLDRAHSEDLQKYPKYPWLQRYKFLKEYLSNTVGDI